MTVAVQLFGYNPKSIEIVEWLSYSLDGQAAVPLTVTLPSRGYGPAHFEYGSATLPRLSSGNHSLIVDEETTFGTGICANVSFAVDTVKPTVSMLSREAKTYTATEIALNFTVSEQVS